MNKYKGVTLTEILFVVVILGVLASIAYPNYLESVNKSHRHAVKADLLSIHLRLEDNYLMTGSYDLAFVDANNCQFCQHDTDRYQLSFEAAEDELSHYVISAKPINAQAEDACQTLTINSTGYTTAAKSGCW